MDSDVKHLLTLVAKGDNLALAELMSRFKGRSDYLARTILKDVTLSDDILSEVIIKIWQQADKIAKLKHPKAYIDVMLYNTALNLIKSTNEHELSADFPGSKSFEEQVAIDMVLSQMDGELRTILILNIVYGYTLFELAKILNLSVKQVRIRLTKAKNLFKETYLNGGVE